MTADPEAAERIAREKLARQIRSEEVPYASDLALLEQHLNNVRRALLAGDVPRSRDLTTAEIAIENLEDRIEEIKSLFEPADYPDVDAIEAKTS